MYASASTWMFNVVMKVAAASLAYPVVGRFITRGRELGFLDDAATFPVVKSHDVDFSADQVLTRTARAVWISVRDPRDCVASLMRYQRLDFATALDFTERSARFCLAHAQHGHACVLRYEAGFMDDPATLDRIADALGCPLPPDVRERIYTETRRSSIDRLIDRAGVAAHGTPPRLGRRA